MKIKYLLVLLPLVFSCGNKTNTGSVSKSTMVQEKNDVRCIGLTTSTFKEELVSNGKLYALQKSDLIFGVNEQLARLNVKNGDYVKKGRLIAVLKQDELRHTIEQSKNNLKKASLELQDLLIGQGYEISDSSNIPRKILEVAKVRSGYASATMDLMKAQIRLRKSEMYAPFSGVIANISHKVYEQVGNSKPFCTLIDNSMFEVEFLVLEIELDKISKDKKVYISPFAMGNRKFSGVISEVNPFIDKHGMVNVRARIKGAQGLIDGMNVKVFVETDIPDQLIVPRSAVLLRDNQEVLFKYVNGIAWWTYVNITHENSTSYTVVANPKRNASLEPGDTIIVSGNLNLAHESPVEIIQ